MKKVIELLPKTEEILSAEEFLSLSSNKENFGNVSSVDFQLDEDEPNDFGSFKVTYKDPIYGEPEYLMEM